MAATIETGLPLSPLPITVAGLKLGEVNDALRWYMHHPEIDGLGWRQELNALGRMIGLPWMVPREEPSLGMFVLAPFFLYIWALIRSARRDWKVAGLSVLFVAPLLLSFYGAETRNARLIWAEVSGRYVLGAVGVMLVYSFVSRRPGIGQRVYGGLLLLGLGGYRVWKRRHTIPVVGVGASRGAGARRSRGN